MEYKIVIEVTDALYSPDRDLGSLASGSYPNLALQPTLGYPSIRRNWFTAHHPIDFDSFRCGLATLLH